MLPAVAEAITILLTSQRFQSLLSRNYKDVFGGRRAKNCHHGGAPSTCGFQLEDHE